MTWTAGVQCRPCNGYTGWVVVDGGWACADCGAAMSGAEIAAYHARPDAEEQR